MFKHILLAIDGSPGSRKAADHAARLLASPEAQLTVLVVIEPSAPFAIPPFDGFVTTNQNPSPEEVTAAQALIAAIKGEIGAARVHTRVEFGAPAELICQVADELRVDLIVVGARGLNPAARWLGQRSRGPSREPAGDGGAVGGPDGWPYHPQHC